MIFHYMVTLNEICNKMHSWCHNGNKIIYIPHKKSIASRSLKSNTIIIFSNFDSQLHIPKTSIISRPLPPPCPLPPQTPVLPECVYPSPPAGASQQIRLPMGPVLEIDLGNWGTDFNCLFLKGFPS